MPDHEYCFPDGRNDRIAALEAASPGAVIVKEKSSRAHHKKPGAGKLSRTAPDLAPSPQTVWVFWLQDEGYGYAFKSVADYQSFITNAVAELTTMPPTKVAAAVDAGANDLARFVKVGR